MPNLVQSLFFLTIYGFQTRPNFLRTAHTFAVVRKKDYFEDGSSAATSPSVISWLPASGTIHPVGSEPGKLYTLKETFDWAERVGARVCATAPTAITEPFYNSFLERIRELQSGNILYIMIDRFSTRPDRETNCIHAVSDLAIALEKLPMLDTGIQHGCRASFTVYNYFRPWFLRSEHVEMSPEHWELQAPAANEILDEEKALVLDKGNAEQEEALAQFVGALKVLLG